MAQLPLKYNTDTNKEGMNDFSAMPAGKYIANITKSTYKQTKAKTGHYLQLIIKVVTGSKKGRVIFENLNLDNPNPIAVEIANKTLNSICQACDKVGVADSSELHGIPMELTLKVNAATATQPESNSVVSYKKFEGDLSVETTEKETETETATEPGEKKKLPWEK